jgi:hypothetical protein
VSANNFGFKKDSVLHNLKYLDLSAEKS